MNVCVCVCVCVYVCLCFLRIENLLSQCDIRGPTYLICGTGSTLNCFRVFVWLCVFGFTSGIINKPVKFRYQGPDTGGHLHNWSF